MLRVVCEIHIPSLTVLIELLRELRLQRNFQWNGTIFDAKFLTLLLFSLCSEKVVHLEITDS